MCIYTFTYVNAHIYIYVLANRGPLWTLWALVGRALGDRCFPTDAPAPESKLYIHIYIYIYICAYVCNHVQPKQC